MTRRRKERISNRRVEQLVTGAMKAAGLKGFSTHKLRHTAATLMYQTGNVDILTLKQLLGHSSVGTTQIYTHLQEFQVRAAIEENPLGKASRKKPGKAALDTTEAETGESREELPGSTAEATENSATAEDSSAPMAAKGAPSGRRARKPSSLRRRSRQPPLSAQAPPTAAAVCGAWKGGSTPSAAPLPAPSWEPQRQRPRDRATASTPIWWKRQLGKACLSTAGHKEKGAPSLTAERLFTV